MSRPILPLVLVLTASQVARATPATEPPPAATAATAERRALDAYEAVRAALAKDALADLAAPSKDLGTAAREARAGAGETAGAHLDALAKASEGLAGAKDLDAARLAFGETSRALVALLVAQPALAEGRWVFECPMAKCYGKWVQASEQIDNPYMGPRMPTCGRVAEVSP